MKFLRTTMLYPFAFAAYPVLSLLAVNIKEVEDVVALRPLLLALALAAVLFFVFRLAVKDGQKAALLTALVLMLFFSYGHVYDFLKQSFNTLARHRFLGPFYLILLGLGVWWILRKARHWPSLTETLNVVGIVLLVFPLFQSGQFLARTAMENRKAEQAEAEALALHPDPGQPLPDVYYIVLDTYTRADALLRDFDLDITPFLDEMRGLGFYVAECSQSNYDYTMSSVTATLNMTFIPRLLRQAGITEDDLWIYMQKSEVRRQLEALGYKTVAFETGFEWSEIKDADYYLRRGNAGMQISPFETLLADTTALRALSDLSYKFAEAKLSNRYASHISRQLFVLDELKNVPDIPGPKFVFVHVLIPHLPLVFMPDGSIVSDPGFYSGPDDGPINGEYRTQGYRNQVQFINSRLPDIARALLEKSGTPPLIVIMGDHGLTGKNRNLILNLYYFPNGGDAHLYDTITPVNSFRVMFNTYFGAEYKRLSDRSFHEGAKGTPVTDCK
ncbi:MAG: hypothetical protein AB1846_12310 [Chloroflexota bacterium]